MKDILELVHPEPVFAVAILLLGVVFGLALALSDWRSKFTVGGVIAAVASSLASLTLERVEAIRVFLESSAVIMPAMYGLNVALLTFLLVLGVGTVTVFASNFVSAKRKGEPEAFSYASKRATALFGTGLYHYVISPPDLAARHQIKDLERHVDMLALVGKTLAREVVCDARSDQHFKDTVAALGRLLLQFSFGDSADLQHYRMAFFLRNGDKLDYLIVINNGDWTSHSMKGFEVATSFMGSAISSDRPMVYPRDKKNAGKYQKRKGARYKSFIAVPVPCGQGSSANIGVLTVDYTGSDEAFTTRRIDELFALSQFIHAIYVLNVQQGGTLAQATSSR